MKIDKMQLVRWSTNARPDGNRTTEIKKMPPK